MTLTSQCYYLYMNVAIKSELTQTFQLIICRMFCVALLLEMHMLRKSEKCTKK